MPASHHFVGTGRLAAPLAPAGVAPERWVAEVRALVDGAGLSVVDDRVVEFPGGGLTVVWVLAESHLVLHLWPEEGAATLDLHVCDYRDSNAVAARDLAQALDRYLFAPGSSNWRELSVPRAEAAAPPRGDGTISSRVPLTSPKM